MKKVDIDRLVSKAMIVTTVILGIMFGAWLIQDGYFSYDTALAMPVITIIVSVIALLSGIVLLVIASRQLTGRRKRRRR